MSTKLYKFLSIFMAIASIVDSGVHLSILSSSSSPFETADNLINDTNLILIKTILSLRIFFSFCYTIISIINIKYRKIEKSSIIINIFYSLFLLVILFVNCTLIRFNDYTPSLIVHILSVYTLIYTLLEQLFEIFNVDNPKIDEKKSWKIKILNQIKLNLMAIGTFCSVIVAIIIGILLRQSNLEWTSRQIMYINFLGEIFLRILKCMVLPLIVSSLVFAIGNMDTKLSAKVATRSISYYLITTILAIITGIILVVLIQPGSKNKVDIEPDHKVSSNNITTIDTVLDLVRNIFPDNIVQATFQYYTTVLKCSNWTDEICSGPNADMDRWSVDSEMASSTNILGVVTFSIVFGIVINQISERELMVNLFKGFNETIMAMTTIIIQMTPIAVTFLILPQIIKVDDLQVLIGATGYYSLTVLAGLAFHSLITLPAIYWIFTRSNPFVMIKHLTPAMMTAFGTSSSSATMPVTFQCLEENAKLDTRIVRFCIPIGATMNMDGTALYEAVAAIFISQYRQKNLSPIQIIIVSLTSTAASIGAAGIPQAGLITMVIVLNAVGLDADDIVLIIVVDWLLDRFRTLINVIGDSLGAALVDHLSKNDLD